MQFDEDMDTVYHELIKRPLEQHGYIVSRSDDPSSEELVHDNIYDRIVQSIWDADYIIADLTRDNSNVAYELGIAHTLNKRTVRISQNLKIPFDIKSQYVISYRIDEEGKPELSERLLDVIQRAEKGKYTFSNIVHDFIDKTSREITTIPPARL